MIFVTPHPAAEKLQYFFGVFLQFYIGVDNTERRYIQKVRLEEGGHHPRGVCLVWHHKTT